MSVSRTLGFAILLATLVAFAAAQDQPTTVKHAPPKATSAASGKEMFEAYCASCHGASAKGDGPAAPALKVQPADLTMLAKNNGGKFPTMKVSSVLNGTADLTAHGDKEMPVWGPIFFHMGGGSSGQQQLRISNLSKYIESLQAK